MGNVVMPLLHKYAMCNRKLCMVNPIHLEASLYLFVLFSSPLFLIPSQCSGTRRGRSVSLFLFQPNVFLSSRPPLLYLSSLVAPCSLGTARGVGHVCAADDCIYQCLHRNQSGRKENENTGYQSIRIPELHFNSHMSKSHTFKIPPSYSHTHSHYTDQ